ncbi:MAG TPA: hypothetical protein DF383_03170 [Deltaproteobacteria bacterium]|nr:hypothetical protein [Deltaproteobacteria bacterium]
MAKCIYCKEKSGFFKAVCSDCSVLLKAVQGLGASFSFREMLDALMATPASNEKIEKFLDADIQGQGSIRDFITARMTNELARTVGQPTDTDPLKVKKIREEEKTRPQPLRRPGEADPFRR